MTLPNTNLLREAWLHIHDANLIWQVGVILGSLALGWLVAYLVKRRFAHTVVSGVDLAGITRVLFPLLSLVFLLIAKSVLQTWVPLALINVFIPLALALTLIRAISYGLRVAFSFGALVQLIEQVLSWLVLLGLIVHLSGFNHDVVQALDEFGITVGKQRISLLLVLEGLLSILVTLIIALWIGRLIETRVMRTETLELNLRIVLAKIVRALLIVVGVLIALPLAGIDITFLSVFGGALGVGLGFGLQKTASNYISGFIILLDRSVRIGDVVTVDNKYGEITQITNRYTVVKSLDGTEAIIPNETMITSTVVNHSFSSRQVRIILQVQISYGSPLEQAMTILREVGRNHPRVLQDPAPEVFIKELGDNGIFLELVTWIEDPEEGQLSLRSALYQELLLRFKAAGISLPYPRRDIAILDSSGIADKKH